MNRDDNAIFGNDLERLFNALNEEVYLQLSGVKRESNLEAVYSRWSRLTDTSVVQARLRGGSRAWDSDGEREGGSPGADAGAGYSADERSGNHSGEQHSADYSGDEPNHRGEVDEPHIESSDKGGRFILGCYIERAMAKGLDALLEAETQSDVGPAGTPASTVRGGLIEVARIHDRAVRCDAHAALCPGALEVAAGAELALEGAVEAVRRLGFTSLATAVENGLGVPIWETVGHCVSILRETSDVYKDLVGWLLDRRCGVRLKDAEEHDVMWLSGPAGPGPSVPPSDILSLLAEDLRSAGIDIRAGGRIVLDEESRDSKISTPLCVPVSVPRRVIVFGEERGAMDYARSHVHEIGRALAFAWVDWRLPFDLRCLVDPGVVHAWGFLFDGLLLEAGWVERLRDYPWAGRWLPLGGALRLIRLRKDAALAMALSETADEESSLDDMAAKVRDALEFSWPWTFRNLSELLDPVHRVRGAMLAHSIKSRLRGKFGEDWYRNPEAGALLLSLWERGAYWDFEILADELSLQPVDPASLARDAEECVAKWH